MNVEQVTDGYIVEYKDGTKRIIFPPPVLEKDKTLRDEFAGQVIAGIHANPALRDTLNNDVSQDVMHAFRVADAMLKAR